MTSCHGMNLLGCDEMGGEATSFDDVRVGRLVLRRGARGPAVEELQRLLGLTGSEVDGDFGAKTEAAVRKLQTERGLKPVDGVVGKDTAAALGKVTRVDFDDGDTVTADKLRASLSQATSNKSIETRPVRAANTPPLSDGQETSRFTPSKIAAGGLAAVAVGLAAFAFFGKR